MNREQHTLFLLVFASLIALLLGVFHTSSEAHADGSEFGGPPCAIASPNSDCSAFNREVIVDFGALQDKYNSIGPPDLLTPKDDDIFSDAGYGRLAPIVAGRFVGMSPSWISFSYGPLSPWGSGPGPSPVTDKEYHYRPSGYFCDSAGCHVVVQRYKEIWTLDNKTKEEHQIHESNIVGLQPMSSLTVFTRDAVADFGTLGNNFAVVENKYGGCMDTKYSLSSSSSFNLPLNGYQDSFIMEQSYFDASGGINGLFSKEAIEIDHLSPCVFVDMQPKDKDNFALHAVSLGDMLIPKDDDLFTTGTNGSSQTFVDNFKGFSHVATYLWQTSVPNIPTHISYHYRPAGYFCSTDGVFCKLILQRYEEIRTLAGGSQDVRVLDAPSIAGLKPVSSVGAFSRDMILDLGALNGKFVLIKESFESSTCAIATYTLAPQNQTEIPLTGQNYLVVDKDYFNNSGGIDGLFQKQTRTFTKEVSNTWDYYGEQCSIGSHVDMQPKNEKELIAHEPITFVGGPNVPQNDDIFNISAHGDALGDKGFIRILTGDISNVGRASFPPSVRHKTHYYHPIGFHKDTNFGNVLVVQRYKEVWTLGDGTTETHQLSTKIIMGLQPIPDIASHGGNSIVKSTTQPPSLITQASSPSTSFPTEPVIPQQSRQSHSFWGNIWCFIKSLFGGSCY